MNLEHFSGSANLVRFRAELTKVCHACGRDSREITLVAVTKNRTPSEINSVLSAGVSIIGENRIQEALQKFPALLPCERHFIGHLQTNKVREVVTHFDCVGSVDSLHLAEKLESECARVNKTLLIFLQVNIAEEATKSGLMVGALAETVLRISNCSHLKLTGFMVIGPHTENSARIQTVFATGKKLVDQFALPYYSAGMSSDWPLAVRAGATHLRIGSALFDS